MLHTHVGPSRVRILQQIASAHAKLHGACIPVRTPLGRIPVILWVRRTNRGVGDERRQTRGRQKQLRFHLSLFPKRECMQHCVFKTFGGDIKSQFLGVISSRDRSPTQEGAQNCCGKGCGKAVSGGVELQKMRSSSPRLIDFAPGSKSWVHLVCNWASVHA